MPDDLIKELDPTLRRLAMTMGNANRLSADRRAGLVSAADNVGPTEVAAHSKDVLVQLSPDRVPERHAALPWRRLTEGIYTVTVPITALEELAREPTVKFIEAGRPMREELDTSLAATHAPVLHGGGRLAPLRGNGVIVGIIDGGFDFSLSDFRDATGAQTRIAFLWDGRQKPECAAPGVNITSSCSLGGRPDGSGGVFPMRVPMSGTSMAAPHVAGIVALIFQHAASLPSPQVLTAVQARKVLTASAAPPPGVPVFDDAWGFGQIDAMEAINVL